MDGNGRGFDGVAIAEGVRRRRGEVERAFARAYRSLATQAIDEVEHRPSLEQTIREVVGYTIECIALGEDIPTPAPSAVMSHAREVARDGLALDSVLLGFIAGHAQLNRFVLGEADGLTAKGLRRLQGLQASILLRFSALLTREYREEVGRRDNARELRRIAIVKSLISGSPVDEEELAYPLDSWHVGLVVIGRRSMDAAAVLAESVGGALLAVPYGGTAWAWIGGRDQASARRIREMIGRGVASRARFAVGEPGRGVDGWRASHLEARAALGVATRTQARATYFSSVAVEAITLQAPELARSLHAAYLAPLGRGARGGKVLRKTLRTYFLAGRNVSSTAATLGVTRRTVENRLRTVEDDLGLPLQACITELEVAIRVEALTRPDQFA
jgi:hypothetical protein